MDLEAPLQKPEMTKKQINEEISKYSQLSPCRQPTITDTRYYRQNLDPIYRGFTEKDFQYYGLSLFQTQNNVLKVSAITIVDCTCSCMPCVVNLNCGKKQTNTHTLLDI